MVKRNKLTKPQKNTSKTPRANREKQPEQEDLEGKGNEADFYVDDAELLQEQNDEQGVNDSDEPGSELDFGAEDYIESESEEEAEKEEEKQKESKLTKRDLRKLLKKSLDGANFALTKIIIVFSKLTVANSKQVNSLDEDNILNQPEITNRIIKFCIKNIPEILLLKYNSIDKEGSKKSSLSPAKNLIRRYLSILGKYLRSAESPMVSFIFQHMEPIIDLALLFKNFVDIFLKISAKTWTTNFGRPSSSAALRTIRKILQNQPEHFESTLKMLYINYLDVAKANNTHTIGKIQKIQNDICELLKIDLDKAYLTIFTFIRKLCMQLRLTINDKKLASIKNIYNWQFVNSLILWGKSVCAYYNTPDSQINLLAYPLIQSIIGVIRLNLVDTFFPMRLLLVNLLNELSSATGIFVPVSAYLLEILESNHFKGYFKNKETTQAKGLNLAVCLKIKKEEFKNYGVVTFIQEETLESLLEYFSLHSFKISFPEIVFPNIYHLKKITKTITDKPLKEAVKNLVEKVQAQSSYVQEKRKATGFSLLQEDKVKAFENELKRDSQCPLHIAQERIRVSRAAKIESKFAQDQDEFIEV